MPQQKDNAGALFKNDKGDNQNRPDYRGPLQINGVEGELAAWLSESKNGQKYMSLKWQPKQDKPQGGGQGNSDRAQHRPYGGAPGPGPSDALDDEIPFAPVKLLP
jgi:hypothetical protein